VPPNQAKRGVEPQCGVQEGNHDQWPFHSFSSIITNEYTKMAKWNEI